MQTMRDQIVARIERLGEGKAFSAKDFLDIASRTMIDFPQRLKLTWISSASIYTRGSKNPAGGPR